MLIGEYTHGLDEKNRISLPMKFRKEIGKKIVVTHGLDNCLFLYPIKEWQAIASKLGSLPIGQADTRGFNRFMLAGAVEIEVDSVGRILIPDFLREFAGFGEAKGDAKQTSKDSTKVVFAGVYNRIEIWNEKLWLSYKKSILGKADELAQKLGDVGAI